MMVSCAVSNCQRRSATSKLKEHGVSYHTFPKLPYLREKWRKFCKNKSDWQPSQHHTICSDHFKKNCFRKKSSRRILLYDAIPTIRTCKCFDEQKDVKTEIKVEEASDVDIDEPDIKKEIEECDVRQATAAYDVPSTSDDMGINNIKTEPESQNNDSSANQEDIPSMVTIKTLICKEGSFLEIEPVNLESESQNEDSSTDPFIPLVTMKTEIEIDPWTPVTPTFDLAEGMHGFTTSDVTEDKVGKRNTDSGDEYVPSNNDDSDSEGEAKKKKKKKGKGKNEPASLPKGKLPVSKKELQIRRDLQKKLNKIKKEEKLRYYQRKTSGMSRQINKLEMTIINLKKENMLYQKIIEECTCRFNKTVPHQNSNSDTLPLKSDDTTQ